MIFQALCVCNEITAYQGGPSGPGDMSQEKAYLKEERI